MPEPLSPSLLEERQLFTFDPGARHEISVSFAALEVHLEPNAQLLHELTYLTAAEFGLIPIFDQPRSVLPVSQPLQVSELHAHLALAKTNCLYIEWSCKRFQIEARQLSPSDVAAFTADVAKLEAVGIPSREPLSEIAQLADAVTTIEHQYRQAPTDLARRTGESGVLRLQGFLWALKLSLPTEVPLQQAAHDSYEAFSLDQPVGGSVAGAR